jgi:Tfp pilus assembly protein PilO
MSSQLPTRSDLATLLYDIGQTHITLGRQYQRLADKLDHTRERQANSTTAAIFELRETIEAAFERLHERSVGESITDSPE